MTDRHDHHLILDIEAIRDPELPPWEPPEDRPNALAPIAYFKVVSIACLLFVSRRPVKLGIIGAGKPEKEKLAALFDWLDKLKPTLVTWNGRRYDLPVLLQRAGLRHGIAVPWWYGGKEWRYRYGTTGHFDVMDYLSEHGAAPAGKLDVAARLVGFPGKFPLYADEPPMDGSQVEEYIEKGRAEDVDNYCLSDVAQLAAVFLRVELLRGILGIQGYQEAAAALLRMLEDDPRMAQLVAKIDRERFLLPGEGEAA